MLDVAKAGKKEMKDSDSDTIAKKYDRVEMSIIKKDGKLIVLEWEEQEGLLQKIKYAPLYALEVLITKSFKEFYKCDKKEYFLQHGFEMSNVTHCNYSSVMEFVKSN